MQPDSIKIDINPEILIDAVVKSSDRLLVKKSAW